MLWLHLAFAGLISPKSGPNMQVLGHKEELKYCTLIWHTGIDDVCFFHSCRLLSFPDCSEVCTAHPGVYHIEANIFKWESEQIYSKYSSGKKVILPYLHQNYNFSINYLLHHVPKTILKACYSYVPILKYTSEWYFVVSTFYFPSLCFPYYHK